MKRNKLHILFVTLLLCASENVLRAQCAAPPPPPVSGATIAGCVSSAVFTLTGTPSGTNVIGWYANPFGGNALSTNSVYTTPPLTSGATYYVGQSVRQSTVTDALAQPVYSINVPAQETRGYYFTAPFDFIITGLRVPPVIGGTVSGIAVIKLPAVPPLYPTVTNSFQTLYLDQTILGVNIVPVNIPVYAGDIIGVLGERDNYSGYGPNMGTGVFNSTLGIGTTTVDLYRMGMLYNLATQTPTDIWTETVNTIGMVEMFVDRTCNSTLTPVTVTVVPSPVVAVNPPPVICANSAYTLSASGAVTYTWTGGPQTSNYVVNPSTTTTYSVQGSVGPGCTSTVSAVTVSVDPGLPTLIATSSSSVVCSGNTLTLHGFGAPSFTWAGGAASITNNVSFVPAATQQYTLYGANSCGISNTMITVTVNPTPTLMTTSTPTAVCAGQTATLTVTGASSYSWQSSAAPGNTFVVAPVTSTVYNVTGTSSAGCPAMAGQVVVAIPNPTVTAGAVSGTTLVCPGGSVALTSSGAHTYSWNTGPMTSTAIVNPMVTQIFTVTGTNTLTQCYSNGTVEIVVFNPTLSISSNTSVCHGAVVTLTADAGAGATYQWSTGFTFDNITITATATASYSVSALTSTIDGVTCTSTGSVVVTVNPNPTVNISSPRTTICKGEKTILTASGGTAFVWKNQSPTTSTLEVSPVVLTLPAVYTVTATDINGCTGTATLGVKVNACTGVNELRNEGLISVYPNPNNGAFTLRVNGRMNLTLSNELGQVIKEMNFTEDQHEQTVDGLSAGIYFIHSAYDGAAIRYKLVVTK